MKSKAWNFILPIISAGIGVVIGGLVDWKKEDSLAAKEFEYRLIETSLSRDLNNAQRNLDFLLDIGLISNIDTAALRTRIESDNLPAVGYWDGFVMGELSFLLKVFYNRNSRFPKDLEEFTKAYPLNLHLTILGRQNLRYKTTNANFRDCQLSFAGADNRWGTDDDKVLLTNDILRR